VLDPSFLNAVNTSMLPISDNTYDLGSSSYRWRNLYTAGALYHAGAQILDVARNLTNVRFIPSIFHFTTYFEGADNSSRWSRVFAGSGTITGDGRWIMLSTGTTANSMVGLHIDFGSVSSTGNLNMSPYTWSGVPWIIRTTVMFSANTNQQIYIGSGIASNSSPPSISWTSEHIGFKVINGELYGTVANGSAESTLDLGAISTNTPYVLRVDFSPNQNACFNVNGSSKGCITSNLPSGTMLFSPCELIIINTAAENKVLYVSLYEAWIGA